MISFRIRKSKKSMKGEKIKIENVFENKVLYIRGN